MACSSSIFPNSNRWSCKIHVPYSVPSPYCSSSSSLVEFDNLSLKTFSYNSICKKAKIIKIDCSLHSTSALNLTKQPPYETHVLPKEYNNTQSKTSTTEHNRTEENQAPKKQWNFFQRAAATALDMAEAALVTKELQHPLPKTADPRFQIAGNFAPVPEQPVLHALPITGKIPECINGVYLRNGANPFFDPVAGHHFFDGDGMIHAVSIKHGEASYACRFTETERLKQEKLWGKPVFPKAIGELHGHSGIARLLLFYARGIFGLIGHTRGTGVANAGLVFFNNRLLAMSEDDLPYHVRIMPSGDLETVGRFDFNEQLNNSMIAHPKIDPETKELFALSYDVISKPYLKYFKFSEEGKKSPDVDVNLEVPTMMHDFAITENFVVIPDQQVVFKLQEMIRGGSPVIFDKRKKSRFGLLPKNASKSDHIVWVECDNTFCFHLWNAWEEPENNEVVVIGSCMTPPDSIFNECNERLRSVLWEIRLNLRTGKSTRRPVIQGPDSDQINLEAGTVNKHMLGRKTQYAYLAIAEPWPRVSGFAKVDLFTGEIKKHVFGDKRFGGEPFFVPRGGDCTREDDGYVLAIVHDEKEWKSQLQIVNAMDLTLEASINLPSRVPYGFHGTFVDSKDLLNQA